MRDDEARSCAVAQAISFFEKVLMPVLE